MLTRVHICPLLFSIVTYTMFNILLFLVLIIIFLIYLLTASKRKVKKFPPGPPKLPILGSYWYILKENYSHAHLALETLSKKYETDILGVYLGDFPAVVTFNIDLCKELLTRDEFIGRNDTIITRSRGLGEMRGLFFIDGLFWKEERRFTLRNLRDHGFGRRSEVVETHLTDEIKYLIEVFLLKNPTLDLKDVCRGDGQCLIPDLFYGPLFNSIFMILTSTRFENHQLRDLGRMALRFQRSGDATGSAISFAPWLRHIAPNFFGLTTAMKSNTYMLDFLKKTLDEHLLTFSSDHCRDFIDEYLLKNSKNNNKLDYEQLLMVILDVMFPTAIAIGHTLSFYFENIIQSLDVQEKIHKEIDSVVGNSRLPNLDDRKKMPYLEASIRESIRVNPINPLGIPRRCMEDTYLKGYFIPKNTIMLPCVWTAHRDSRIFENPTKFIPERFIDNNGNLFKKDITMGFGAGKRVCIGETFARQTMFLIISSLLQSFNFCVPKDRQKLKVVPGVNLSFEENWIQVKPRQ